MTETHGNGRRKQKASSVDVAALLRGAGLRRTGPRIAVLRRLAGASAPQSHAQICSALHSLDLDRATIYRNLMDLAESGIVTRTDVGDHVWRFELRGAAGSHAHPHLVCSSCGDVECLADAKVEIRVPRRRLRADNVEIQLKGLCEKCA